jgi:hypothetical protein
MLITVYRAVADGERKYSPADGEHITYAVSIRSRTYGCSTAFREPGFLMRRGTFHSVSGLERSSYALSRRNQIQPRCQ